MEAIIVANPGNAQRRWGEYFSNRVSILQKLLPRALVIAESFLASVGIWPLLLMRYLGRDSVQLYLNNLTNLCKSIKCFIFTGPIFGAREVQKRDGPYGAQLY